MQLAVISDIHGNLPALQAVLDDIARQRIARIVNLGDILSGPLQVAQTADYLMGQDWLTIAGNHERQLLKLWDGPAQRIRPDTSDGHAATQLTPARADWLRALPARATVGDDILLVHGTPGSDLVYWMETVTPDFGVHGSAGLRMATAQEIAERRDSGPGIGAATLVLCGHTHIPRVTHSGGALIVNPGSVGLQAYWDDHPHYHHTEVGAPHARYAVVEQRDAGWTARLHAVPYDWDSMARLATANGRPDWAYALTTGRMLPRRATIGA